MLSGAMSSEELYELSRRFWSFDHHSFDHRGFLAAAVERMAEGRGVRTQDECEWSHVFDCDAWNTSCGYLYLFSFTDGGPSENEFRFCCYCGGALKERVAA